MGQEIRYVLTILDLEVDNAAISLVAVYKNTGTHTLIGFRQNYYRIFQPITRT